LARNVAVLANSTVSGFFPLWKKASWFRFAMVNWAPVTDNVSKNKRSHTNTENNIIGKKSDVASKDCVGTSMVVDYAYRREKVALGA
jgi:hypothetical protein